MSCTMPTRSGESEKEVKSRARRSGSMDPTEDMLEKELGDDPAVEYGDMGCVLDKDKLCKHQNVVKGLRGYSTCFAQEQLQGVVHNVGARNAKKNAQWIAIQPHLDKWAKDVAERLRSMMRCVGQALLKDKVAPWARFFLPPPKRRVSKKAKYVGV